MTDFGEELKIAQDKVKAAGLKMRKKNKEPTPGPSGAVSSGTMTRSRSKNREEVKGDEDKDKEDHGKVEEVVNGKLGEIDEGEKAEDDGSEDEAGDIREGDKEGEGKEKNGGGDGYADFTADGKCLTSTILSSFLYIKNFHSTFLSSSFVDIYNLSVISYLLSNTNPIPIFHRSVPNPSHS